MRPEIIHTSREIRTLYAEACSGDGAAERRIARRQLETIADRNGERLSVFFDYHGLSLAAYFASKPIDLDLGR